MDKKHCVGCRQNFYNGNNDMGIKECMHLKYAKLETKWRIHWHTPTFRENFTKCHVPGCFCQTGQNYYTDNIKAYPRKGKA